MRLNLGSGATKIPGFVNVDLCHGSDIQHDLREPLPFKDGSIDEIKATHVIESFYQWELKDILKDWKRVLNGTITIEFTDLNDTIKLYLNGEIHGLWGLYGRQDEPIDPIVTHKYVWTKENLINLLEECGFKDIQLNKNNIKHHPVRDWVVTCHA